MIPKKRRMEYSRAIEIIKKNEYGVLSTSSLESVPYGCAINYFYIEDEKLSILGEQKIEIMI